MMNPLVWAAGYSAGDFERDCVKGKDSLSHLEKVGGTVLFAAIIEAGCWGAATRDFSGGWSLDWQLALAAFGAALGLLFVFFFDRPAVYAMDVRAPRANALSGYVWLRVCLILVMTGLALKLAVPSLLGPELAQFSLEQRERSDRERRTVLPEQYRLPQTLAEADRATVARQELEVALATIPPPVAEQLAEARECWRDYQAQRRRYARHPGTDTAARLTRARAACARRQRDAQRLLDNHRAETSTALSRARNAEERARATYRDVDEEAREFAARARGIEEQAMVPESETVQWGLLTSSPGTLILFVLVLGAAVALQTLPITTKLLLGQSRIGVRIGRERAVEAVSEEEQVQAEIDRIAQDRFLRQVWATAMQEATERRQVRAAVASHLEALMIRCAPMEAAYQAMRTVEAHKRAMDEIARRTPSLNLLAQRWWINAVRTTMKV